MKTPYGYADKQLIALKRYVSAEFHNSANLLNFDELNVASVKELTDSLYSRLKTRNEVVFRAVAKHAYSAAMDEIDGSEEQDGVAIVAMLLKRYDPITQYVYKYEARRKQERLAEALIAAPNRESARIAFDRAARLWFDQSRQYTDLSVDEARMQAFKDSGIRQVEWMAEQNERTCSRCRELDGKVFRLEDVPQFPQHHHCRCWLVPVRK